MKQIGLTVKLPTHPEHDSNFNSYDPNAFSNLKVGDVISIYLGFGTEPTKAKVTGLDSEHSSIRLEALVPDNFITESRTIPADAKIESL